MKTGISLNSGIVNWPEIKTRRIRLSGSVTSPGHAGESGREKGVLHVVAENLEHLKEQVVQAIHRL
jgi:hypothetical protein